MYKNKNKNILKYTEKPLYREELFLNVFYFSKNLCSRPKSLRASTGVTVTPILAPVENKVNIEQSREHITRLYKRMVQTREHMTQFARASKHRQYVNIFIPCVLFFHECYFYKLLLNCYYYYNRNHIFIETIIYYSHTVRENFYLFLMQ